MLLIGAHNGQAHSVSYSVNCQSTTLTTLTKQMAKSDRKRSAGIATSLTNWMVNEGNVTAVTRACRTSSDRLLLLAIRH